MSENPSRDPISIEYESTSEKGFQFEKRLLINHVSSPLNFILQTSHFFDSEFKYLSTSDSCIKVPLRTINANVQVMCIKELEKYAREAQVCIYNAPCVEKYHYTVQESFEIFNKLLLFQLNDNFGAVNNFLKTLTAIIERNNGIQNTFV